MAEFWLGDAKSFEASMVGYEWRMGHPVEAAARMDESDDEDLMVKLVDAIYQTHDNIAVITVAGAMVNEDSFWNLMFGDTSYNTVSTALNRALQETEITDIVLNLDTTGGDSEGISSVSDNISLAAMVKPVHAFSNTAALSAGYWMASSATRLYGSPMSEWGSIGVVTTHTSRARMLKDAGLDVTVIRGGKYKALGHPAEKLSPAGKKMLEEKTDTLYGFFLEQVSAKRTSLNIKDKDIWAEGRTFFAAEAMRLGLIDEVTTFNQLINTLLEDPEDTVTPPGSTGLSRHEVHAMPKQVILDAAAQAQVASGVAVESVTQETTDLEAQPTTSVTETEDSGTTEPRESEVTSQPVTESSEIATNESGAATDLVAFLKDELKTLRADMATADSKIALLSAQLSDSEQAVKTLNPIAVEATQKLQIALGQVPVELDGLSADGISLQYTASKTAFNARFKVGKTSLGAEAQPESISAEQEALKIGIVPKA